MGGSVGNPERKTKRRASQGTCSLCNGTFSKAAMAKHLEGCIRRRVEGPQAAGSRKSQGKKVLHLVVEGHGLPEYWMHLQALADAPLKALDDFLRDTWLECCGHLSAFRIRGKTYELDALDELLDDVGEEGEGPSLRMDVALGKVLGPGLTFNHEYDFGTTTALKLRVVSAREERARGQSIRLLARNDPPAIACESCGKPATQVCSQCICDGGGWLCAGCGRTHECEQEMFLPVVNSPRVGMCGYTGA